MVSTLCPSKPGSTVRSAISVLISPSPGAVVLSAQVGGMTSGGVIIEGNSRSIKADRGYEGLFSGICSTTESRLQLPIPRGGTISNFYFASFGDSEVTVTFRVNGSNTSIKWTTSPSGFCNDLTDSVPVTAGETISVFTQRDF
jgi:hypothetical protein